MAEPFIKTSVLCCLVQVLFFHFLRAGNIGGFIYDKVTHEQLIGATIVIEPGAGKTVSALNGKYTFKNIGTGRYHLRVSFVGYVTADTLVSVDGIQPHRLDFNLQPEISGLSSVIVSARANRESDEYARKREQFSDNITNIVSSNTITISPDVTVANLIQRVSGVSVERSGSGDGEYAIIRGMDKRYNTTLINGIKIPSPDDRNRFVPLDIFPAELLERLEVIKSLTPDMEGDATGGVMNLVMKDAPDKFRLEGNIGTGYSQVFFNRPFLRYDASAISNRSPGEILGAGVYAPASAFPCQNLVTGNVQAPVNKIFGLTAGDRFLHKKLGIIFSGSYQNTYRGNNSNRLVQNATIAPAPDSVQPNHQTFSDIEVRQLSYRLDRTGIETKIDYRFNSNNSLSLFATYVQLNEHRAIYISDSLLGGYTMNNYVGSFAVTTKHQTLTDLQGIYNTTLQGKHKLSDILSSDWSFALSGAKRQRPDNASFSVGQQINPDYNTNSVTLGPPEVGKEPRLWKHNTDRDIAGYLNFHYAVKGLEEHKALFRFGGMYRHKHRDNYDNEYSLTPVNDSNSNYQLYRSVPESRFTFQPSNGALGSVNSPGNYGFTENVGAAYVQMKYSFNSRWQALAGLRIENTRQHFVDSLPVSVAGKSGAITYTDFLPCIQAKYTIDEKRALRFSYFRSIYRPAYADLIPYPDNFTDMDFPPKGDPYLQHTQIDNIDTRYEVFPKGLDQLMVGVFYKSIMNPIEYSLERADGFGADLNRVPHNFGNANNYGAELVFRKYFGKFGIAGNYTFTSSVINADKEYFYITSSGGSTYTKVGQRRPLQGQSAHTGNISLLFKDA